MAGPPCSGLVAPTTNGTTPEGHAREEISDRLSRGIGSSPRAGVGSASEQPAVERQALARRAAPQSETIRTAEGVGFEPTVGCPTHAFQACRFGRSRTPPGSRSGYRGGSLVDDAAVGPCAT